MSECKLCGKKNPKNSMVFCSNDCFHKYQRIPKPIPVFVPEVIEVCPVCGEKTPHTYHNPNYDTHIWCEFGCGHFFPPKKKDIVKFLKDRWEAGIRDPK